MVRNIGYLLILVIVALCAIALLAPQEGSAYPSAQRHALDQAHLSEQRAGPDVGTITGKPSVSAQFINAVLCTYRSPACGAGGALYQLGIKYGIDPVYPLAFFLNESSFGRAGWAVVNHSLGNIRCSDGYACNGGYRYYATWQAGFEDWYQLIRTLYIDAWHCSTVERIIPHYAPNADHNDEAHYIAVVERAVALWRAGKVVLP